MTCQLMTKFTNTLLKCAFYSGFCGKLNDIQQLNNEHAPYLQYVLLALK